MGASLVTIIWGIENVLLKLKYPFYAENILYLDISLFSQNGN